MRPIDADDLKNSDIRKPLGVTPYDYGAMVTAFMDAINKAQTINPWHRVEDELPDDSRDVIIFTASRIIGVGSFIRPNWYQWYSGGGLPVDVTNWMPLPEPPKE